MMEREAWYAVHGDTKSWTWLSNWTTTKKEHKITFGTFIECYAPDIFLSVSYLFWSLLQHYFPDKEIKLEEIKKFAQEHTARISKAGQLRAST